MSKILNLEDSIQKLESDGYQKDEFFRIIDERDARKTYAFREHQGKKTYNTMQAQTTGGVHTFLSAYDGDEKELSLEFSKDGSFVMGSVYQHRGGKAGTGSSTKQLAFGFGKGDAEELIELFLE